VYQKFRRDGEEQVVEVESIKREWRWALVFDGQVYLPVKTHSYTKQHGSQYGGTRRAAR
jgi:hypothetical protein